MSKKLRDIEILMVEFREASSQYEAAHEKAQAASRHETEALNRLSNAQKAIDDWHKSVRKGAPWNSEWHQQRRTRYQETT